MLRPGRTVLAARLLGVAPEECWVIEDSKPGVAAGLAAGMRVIAIANTHPAGELRPANHIVQTYEEIERLLLPAGQGADFLSPSAIGAPFS